MGGRFIEKDWLDMETEIEMLGTGFVKRSFVAPKQHWPSLIRVIRVYTLPLSGVASSSENSLKFLSARNL